MKEMANCIRSLRQSRQLTQAELAQALGVQYQTVSKWETGVTLPDVTMLPRIADFFGISMDELFGRKQRGCAGEMADDQMQFLLKTYSQMYGPEAGPWNLSVENKYLMYRFADFFETHFKVETSDCICNIGIGSGEWDEYLSYKLKGGTLTSIDRLEICCRQLEQRLLCEGNPSEVRVICSDVLDLNLERQFDVVTMVGSTVMESGTGTALLEKALGFVKKGGAMYYQSIDGTEDSNLILKMAFERGMKLSAYLEDNAYGFLCRYYKFEHAACK